MDVFVAKALAHCVIQTVVFAIVLTALAMFGYHVLPMRPVELGGILVLTAMLAFGLGLLLAAIGSLMPDARGAIKIMFMPLYFASGILFPVTRFPDSWVQLLSINPVLHLVELSRAVSVEHYQPMKYTSMAYPLGLALLTSVIGLMLYRLRYLARVSQ